MASDNPAVRGSGDSSPPDDDLTAFINLLNELKATGCNLLVVGDESREVFTRASGQLLGDADVTRHRVLAVTDATSQSIAERLPEPNATPRPLTETTTVLNHTGAPRSVTAATNPGTPPELAGIEEVCIADPELRGLQSGLTDAIAGVGNRANLNPSDLRVGIDSLDPLLDHYGADAVKRCLDAVGGYVRDQRAMSHYVLRESYDSDSVQTLLPTIDAVIELRTVNPEKYDHDAQQRWHVPRHDLTTEWTPL
jgi:hypothetical protein